MNGEREIDEAFGLVRDNVVGYLDWSESADHSRALDPSLGKVLGGDAVRVEVESLEVETPVELDVLTGSDGSVQLGCAPPLYRLETGITPVFHRLRLTIVPERELLPGAAESAESPVSREPDHATLQGKNGEL